MNGFRLKKRIFYAALGGFWAIGTALSPAQTLLWNGIPDPGVLVAAGAPGITTPSPETSLVDIMAVDAPSLHTISGKTGIGTEQRFGQGIVIDAQGIIATNRHIIGHASHVYVRINNGQTMEANILRISNRDLCLIKINTPSPLRAVALANTSEMQVGQNVIAIPNATLNHQQKVGGQIIKVYKDLFTDKIEVLEMNIPLDPGDSGGPILNTNGSLLGLIMGKQISDPSKSYAIASNQIQQEYFNYRNSILN